MTNYQSSIEKITRSGQIQFVLKRIHQSRTMLQLQFQDEPEIFQSMVLNIDEQNGLLHMDGLNPDHGNHRLNENKPFTIKTSLNDVEITFKTTVDRLLNDSKGHYFTANLPEVINYFQKRSSFRITLAKSFAPKVVFVTKDNQRMEGQVDNISLGGIRAIFENPTLCYWTEGDRIPNCIIQLSLKNHIKCSIEIRNSRYERGQKRLTIGAQFVNLGKLQSNAIARYVAATERAQRRKGI